MRVGKVGSQEPLVCRFGKGKAQLLRYRFTKFEAAHGAVEQEHARACRRFAPSSIDRLVDLGGGAPSGGNAVDMDLTGRPGAGGVKAENRLCEIAHGGTVLAPCVPSDNVRP